MKKTYVIYKPFIKDPHSNIDYQLSEPFIMDEEEVDTEMIWEGTLSDPPLQVGDLVYIPSIDKKIPITERVRNVLGAYIYETDYVVKTIDDEESKLKTKKLFEEYINKEEVSTLNNNKWYQFWK